MRAVRGWAVFFAIALTLAVAACGTAEETAEEQDAAAEPAEDPGADADAGEEAAGSETEPADLGTLRLGYQTNVWGMPVYSAIQTGRFEELGLGLEEITVDSGNRVRDLMVAEQADVGTFAGPTFIIGAEQGDVVAIGLGAIVGGTTAIVARDGEGIETLEDLEGRRVGLQAGSSIGNIAVHEILPSVGLEEGDYELVNLSVTDMIAAMASGQVDAMVNVEPYNAIAEAQGLGQRLVDFTDYDTLPMFVGIRESYLEENYEEAVAFMMGLEQNAAAWEESPDEIYQLITDFYVDQGFDTDLEAITDAAGRMEVELDYFDGIEEYMTELAEFMIDEGQVSEVPDWSSVLRTDVLEEARRRLGE
ncbi:MAG: PhnD/SsuA/transferrin family substrate-binding protein [Chloroflexi bacterium]|nr:PhnD/SsuA/transferrin family substrate-binding protein [Chloroflexota bacterium]